jgi:hypothetical protein
MCDAGFDKPQFMAKNTTTLSAIADRESPTMRTVPGPCSLSSIAWPAPLRIKSWTELPSASVRPYPKSDNARE